MRLFLVLLSFLLVTFVNGQDSRVQRLDSLLQQLEQKGDFNGNVLIASGDKIIFERSIGMAEFPTGRKLTSSTVFELASVSKQFTAMGIMILQQKGKLSYADSLRKFFPELPYTGITIRQLLNHTSGLPDYMDLMSKNWDSTRIATNKDMLALLAAKAPPALFTPGSKWEYSNTGYAVLASVIEKVSGKSYGDFLQKEIFKPLGMASTRVFRRRYEKRMLPDYALGYIPDPVTRKPSLPDSVAATASMVYSLDGIVGDGTVNSNTGDLLKWSLALDAGKLVGKDMIQEAFQSVQLPDGKETNYGYGWAVAKAPGIGRLVNHSGGWPGYRTFIEKELDSNYTIIVLTNYEKGEFPIRDIRNALLNRLPAKPQAAAGITVDAAMLQQYVGDYELVPEFVISISVKEGKLFGQATGQDAFELFADKTDEFFLKVVEARIKFVREKDGKVTSLILYQNGEEMPGKKIK